MTIPVTFYAPSGYSLKVLFRAQGAAGAILDAAGTEAVEDVDFPQLYRCEVETPVDFTAGWYHASILQQSDDTGLGAGDVYLIEDGSERAIGETKLDTEALAEAVLQASLGTGPVIVDHDYGGADALQVVDDSGASVPGAVITAYLSTDYAAGNRSAAFVRGQTTTDANGRWKSPLALEAETYVLVITKPLGYVASTVTVVVEAS